MNYALNMSTNNKSVKSNTSNGIHHKINEASPNSGTHAQKSTLVAYFLWLIGGIFGAHHFYLGRDEHGIVWLTTLGGYFGCGWIRDLFKLPTYVKDANNDPKYIESFKETIKRNKKPPFSMSRFMGQFLVSSLWANVFFLAIPEDELYGINFKHLYYLVPFVAALGSWYVGNIGREKGSIIHSTIAAYLCYPTIYYFGNDNTWIFIMAICSSLAFDSFSKQWRLESKKKRSISRRIVIVTAILIIYYALWSSYFYFNATITDSEGEEIKLSEAVKHFFTSPIWMDVKASLEHMWNQAKHQGFWGIWKELIDLSDPRGEMNAYKVLGLSQTASQSEVTSKWRALSREHHPDKVKGSEEERRAAQEKFMEIQQAYEILSSAKNRRQRKNRKPS